MKLVVRAILLASAGSLTVIAVGLSHAAPPVGTGRTPVERAPTTPAPTSTPKVRPPQPRVVAARAIAGRAYGGESWPYEVDVSNPTNAAVRVTIEQDAQTGGYSVEVPAASTKTVRISSALLPARCAAFEYPLGLAEYRDDKRIVRRTPNCTFKLAQPSGLQVSGVGATPIVHNKVFYRNAKLVTQPTTCGQPLRATADVVNDTSQPASIELRFGGLQSVATVAAGATQQLGAGTDAFFAGYDEHKVVKLLLTSPNNQVAVLAGSFEADLVAECRPTWELLP